MIIDLSNDQIKQIKRINQRLAQMEKSGYLGTQFYNDFVSRILASGLDITSSVNKDPRLSGNVRLSRSKRQNDTYGTFTLDEQLDYIERYPKLSDELRKAKKKKDEYFPFGSTPKERVINKYDFNARLNEHLDSMYLESYRDNEYSQALRSLVKTKGLRNTSYEVLIDMMDQIDNKRRGLIAQNVPYKSSLFEEKEGSYRDNSGARNKKPRGSNW